jgi:Transposase DDE domain
VLLIDAFTKIPLAVKVGKLHEHEALWTRALVTQARMNLAGVARLHKVIFDKGVLDGTTLWWLYQQGITFVVPAKANKAVTADARAQAAAGEEIRVGRRAHTVVVCRRAKWRPSVPPMAPCLLWPLRTEMSPLTKHAREAHAGAIAGEATRPISIAQDNPCGARCAGRPTRC